MLRIRWTWRDPSLQYHPEMATCTNGDGEKGQKTKKRREATWPKGTEPWINETQGKGRNGRPVRF